MARSGADSAGTVRSGSAASRRVTIKAEELNARGLKVVDMSGQGMATIQASLFNSESCSQTDHLSLIGVITPMPL